MTRHESPRVAQSAGRELPPTAGRQAAAALHFVLDLVDAVVARLLLLRRTFFFIIEERGQNERQQRNDGRTETQRQRDTETGRQTETEIHTNREGHREMETETDTNSSDICSDNNFLLPYRASDADAFRLVTG